MGLKMREVFQGSELGKVLMQGYTTRKRGRHDPGRRHRRSKDRPTVPPHISRDHLVREEPHSYSRCRVRVFAFRHDTPNM